MKKPNCVKCGKPLSDPFSIAVGMGPDCRGGLSRRGWKFPKPSWRTHKGRVVLEGYRGKVEPPAVMTEQDDQLMRKLVKRKAEDNGTDNEHEG